MPSSFCKFQLITVLLLLLLICYCYLRWSARFISVKLCVKFSVFDSVSFLLQFIFLLNKMNWLFAPRPLIFRLPRSFQIQWYLYIFNDMVTNLLNLENQSSENIRFPLNIWHFYSFILYLYLITFLFLFLTYLFL